MTSEYTPEVMADLNAMVAAEKGRWGLSDATQIRLLNVSENATFALSDPARDNVLILRVHRLGYSSEDEIRSELAWIRALMSDQVIETASPVAGVDGAFVQMLKSPAGLPSRFAVAFERVPGREPEAGSDLPDWFVRLGERTAQMHRHAKGWARPDFFTRKLWDFDAMVGAKAFWGPWWAGIGLDVAGGECIELALEKISRRLAAYGQSTDRFGLVHADLRLANLLVEGPHLRIIDFDDCGLSWFFYDFAASVSFIEHEPVLPELLKSWVRGYASAGPVTREDIAMLPTFVTLRRVLLTAWLASHSEIPFARDHGADFTAGTVDIARRYSTGLFLSDAVKPFYLRPDPSI